MNFTEDTYVVAIWFVVDADCTKDWLASLFRQKGDPPGQFTYESRLRFYAGTSDPFDESDDKRWLDGVTHMPEADAEAALDAMARAFRDRWGVRRLHKVSVHGNAIKAYRKMRSLPFVHVKFGEAPITVTGKGGVA